MVLSLSSEASKTVKSIATASWAFAASLGIDDEELTMEQNLASIRNLAATVASAVTQVIQVGAHGVNIEDNIPARGIEQGIEHSLHPLSEQIRRLQLAVRAAADGGLPDFAINAHCDVFALKDDLNLDN
ncbi:C6 transcription factor [Fusarium mundagurra]|uniref:C6 transcription factor n=1 Tax=Fusarium mundagurra TaxID=1567541 RepID=A0A8H5YRI0_9HYPO|nr:C6 transcription factor [Fusarium mundagurra]